MSLWQKGCDDARAGRSREYSFVGGSCNGYTNGYDWGLRRKNGYEVRLMDGSTRTFTIEEVDVARECFLVWRDRNMIHIAKGDDGDWEEIAVYADALLPDIIAAMSKVFARKGIDINVLNVPA